MALKVVNEQTVAQELSMTEALEQAIQKIAAQHPNVVTIIYEIPGKEGVQRLTIPDSWAVHRSLVDIYHEMIHGSLFD